ncbi:MAG: hypothetical protein M1609_13690 [Firmicutes bacterium]|nr:hypothetical protein [Bacillota bacterium]
MNTPNAASQTPLWAKDGEFTDELEQKLSSKPRGADLLDNPFLVSPAKIEFPATIEQPFPEAVQTIEEEVIREEGEIEHLKAKVLGELAALAKKEEETAAGQPELLSSGELRFDNHEQQVVSVSFLTPKQEDEPAADKADQGKEKPQRYERDLNLIDAPAGLVDFGYFFRWSSREAVSALEVVQKAVSARNLTDTKKALFDDLLLGQILGFGEKKPKTGPEKQAEEKEREEARNRLWFFDQIRNAARFVISPERKRSLRERLQKLNRLLKRSNLSYEGDLEQNGQIRENALLEEDKANSIKSEEEIKNEKRKKIAMVSKGRGRKGPGITLTADKAHNFNNAAKLAG